MSHRVDITRLSRLLYIRGSCAHGVSGARPSRNVNGRQQSASLSVVVVPESQPPRIFTSGCPGDRQQVNAGEAVMFTALSPRLPPFPFEYLFDFGDGSDPVRTDEVASKLIRDSRRFLSRGKDCRRNRGADEHFPRYPCNRTRPAVTYPTGLSVPDPGRRRPGSPLLS
jgi:hypothetical protein